MNDHAPIAKGKRGKGPKSIKNVKNSRRGGGGVKGIAQDQGTKGQVNGRG